MSERNKRKLVQQLMSEKKQKLKTCNYKLPKPQSVSLLHKVVEVKPRSPKERTVSSLEQNLEAQRRDQSL